MGVLVDNADILAVLKLGGVEEFNSNLASVNKKVQQGAQDLATAVNIGIAAGAAALGLAVANAANFERAMANVNTIANLDPSGLGKMADSVKAIAMVSPTNMASLTSGLYDLVSSGVPAADATQALALSAQAASAGLTGVDTAVRAGMANINAYGLPVSELTGVFDLQFQAVNIGVLSYEQLATAIGNVLPAANNLKVPMDQLYASVAQLTLSGIDPQSSTTYLGRLFSQLSDPEVTGRIEANGIKVWGPDGSFRGLVAVLKDMDAAVEGMSDEQRVSFFNSIGFTEQSNKALLALIGNLNGENGFLATMEKMGQAPGAVSRAFAIQNETFSAQADTFKNIVQVSFIDIGNALLPVLTGIVTLANNNPEATRTFAASIGTLAIGFAGVAAASKGIAVMQGMFLALAASPIGAAALAVAGIAAGIVAINTAIEANQASMLEEIGATSENIDKVGQLSTTIETLRGKKQLTKDETVLLKDSEVQLGDMLDGVGLKLGDYSGNLDKVKDSYAAIKLVNLNQQLDELEKQLGSDTGILSGIAGGLATLSPSLSGLISAEGVDRAGNLAERIKAIKLEISELNKPEGVAATTGEIDALGNAAAGADGKGGAANKIKLTADQLKALKEANERENYKQVKGMAELGFIAEIQTKAIAADTNIRGLTDALANKQTGLIGKFPEVQTGGSNAALGVSALDGAMLALSNGLNSYNPKVGALVDNVWKIASDEKLEKSEIPGLFRSIGNAAGEANPKVGGLFNLFAGFVESGFNPLSLAMGGIGLLLGDQKDKADLAVTSWEGVEKVLGTTGTAMRTLSDDIKAVNAELELDVLTAMETKMQKLAYEIATRTAEYDRLDAAGKTGNASARASAENLKKVIDDMKAGYLVLEAQAKEYTSAFKLEQEYDKVTDSISTLTDKYKTMSDKFGESANLEGLKELLGKTVEEGDKMLKTLGPNTTAFDELNKKIEAARTLMQGLVSDIGAVNSNPVSIPVVMNPTGVVTPGQTTALHNGGFPVAHDGYLAPDETLVKMLKNEMVLKPAATMKFGASRLLEFNATLDPSVLAGGSRASSSQQQTVVNIIAGNTTPETYFRMSDKYIQPRINTRTQKYQVKANPYAG